ncbi:MAG: HNH endonuclease signature motif containing protein [Lutibacter sp.]|jgi:uncharacterized protein (TIGR02646 family)
MGFSKKIREQIFKKYNGKCAYCGCELPKNWQIDHIHPKHNKGTDDFENLNPACFACNNYKNGNRLETFRNAVKTMLNKKRIYLFASKTKMDISLNYGAVKMYNWDGKFYFEKNQTALPMRDGLFYSPQTEKLEQ